MKNYGIKSKILLGQQLTTWKIMIKNMKIKFSLNDNLSLKKTPELHNLVRVVRSIFHEDSK